ncbi:S8 family serine peptidase [Oryzobacter sp. R7]|uniref:S8 family peptidase n=1 Tax=Oryzobacter faecalis TaxID=3388656 RepID=UPI00398CE496
MTSTHPARLLTALAVAATTSLGAVLPLTSAAAAPPPAARSVAPAAAADDTVRVIVTYDRMASAGAVARHVARSGKVTRTMKRTPVLVATVPRSTLADLRRAPHVRGVMLDIPEPVNLDSTLPVINADDVHTAGLTGAGATVAVLDTGVDVDHPFLGGRVVAQYCSSSPADGGEQSLCPDGTTEDDSADVDGLAACLDGTDNICDHGTHVAGIAVGNGAGIVGAPAAGVAPGANIIAMQVFTRFNDAADCPGGAPCVASYPSDQINALDDLAALDTANPGWNVIAANMSLGGGMFAAACDGEARKTQIDTLLAQGVATVISAGNDSHGAAVGRPGCISTAFTVGATNDDDTVAGYSNRGTLLDVLAPGSAVDSSVPDDAYGAKNGTSMAAPHVTGALAVLRQREPTRSVADLMQDLRDTGVDVSYASGGGTVTTPRIDLLAAANVTNEAPVVTLDALPAAAPEGSAVTATGTWSDADGDDVTLTASTGTVTEGAGTWTWTSTRGDDGSVPVTITATDPLGKTGSVGFTATWTNVAPTVSLSPVATIAEGGTVTVSGSFSDPGWLDTHTVTIDWGTTQGVTGSQSVDVTPGGPGPVTATFTASYSYGDDGSYPVTVTVTDDDSGSEDADRAATVTNVAPTATLDTSTATTWSGQTIFFVTEGVPATFEADSTDPGSDDLTASWSFGDGATASHTSPVNPPGADPASSPTVQPRSITDAATHTYTEACSRTLEVGFTDDDGGASPIRTGTVVVLGTSTDAGGLGWWQTDYRGIVPRHSTAEKLCLLSTVRTLSTVFDEERPLTTVAHGEKVLWPKHNASKRDTFDSHLLTLWLNVASGSVGLGEPLDADGDGSTETTVGAFVLAAETTRNSVSPSSTQLPALKDVIERVNETH